MSTWYLKSSAIILMIGALIGIILVVGGMIYLWINVESINREATRLLDLTDDALATSAEGLELLNDSLIRTNGTIAVLKDTSDELSASLTGTIPLVEQLGVMVGEDMTTIVRDTQAALTSAQSSARLVDDTLRIITAIPLIGRRYEPSIPLGESIAQVTESLNGLPESFREIQTRLETAAGQLETIQEQVDGMGDEITEAENSITDAQAVIEEYQAQVSALQDYMLTIRQRLPGWIRMAAWGFSLFLVWMAVVQVSLLNQALTQFQRARQPD
jgi:chromosome segregation ATPase